MAGPTRAQKAQNYSHLLEGAKLSFKLDPPFIKPDSRHIFHQYVVRVPEHRDALMEHKRRDVATKIYYPIPCTCRSASHTWATKQASFRKPRKRAKLSLSRCIRSSRRSNRNTSSKQSRTLNRRKSMSQQPRVLVTGAGGFIGYHLTNYLVDRGYWVRGVDIKTPEFDSTRAVSFFCST